MKSIFRTLSIVTAFLWSSLAFCQDTIIQLTKPIPTANPKQQGPDRDRQQKSIRLDTKRATNNNPPIGYGMSSQEVQSKLGRPVGEVNFGRKLTYFYNDGEIEFTENKIVRFKWKGTLYTTRKMPPLARKDSGKIELSIPAEDTLQVAIDHPNEKHDVDQKSTVPVTGKNKTTKVRTNAKPIKKSSPKSAFTSGPHVLEIRKNLDGIQQERERQIREAGLEDLLLNSK